MASALSKQHARDKAAGGKLAADQQQGAKVLTAAYTIPYSENGYTYYLDLAAGFTVTLPNVKLGLKLAFVVKTAPTGGNYTIAATTADADKIYGNALSGAASTPAGAPGSAADNVAFDAGVALPGDRIELESDGTNWYALAVSAANSGVDFAG